MEKLTLVTAPHVALTSVAVPVQPGDADIKHLSEEMIRICREYEGIGLAANQVNVLKRVIVVNILGKKHQWRKSPMSATDGPMVFINPVLEPISGAMAKGTEGCLSHPGKRVTVMRHTRVRCTYLDLDWGPRTLIADDLFARCLAHEVDHLDGVNIV